MARRAGKKKTGQKAVRINILPAMVKSHDESTTIDFVHTYLGGELENLVVTARTAPIPPPPPMNHAYTHGWIYVYTHKYTHLMGRRKRACAGVYC